MLQGGGGIECSLSFFSDGNSCQCVPYGEECVRAPSMSGNDLFRHDCIYPTDKISLLENMEVELPNFCAFYSLQERLLRVEEMPPEVILPRCDDGTRNGDEEKVDCGGSCDLCPPEVSAPCRERWFGIHCEGSTLVRLDLAANNLVGRIDGVLHLLPPELRFLDLRENALRGPIPPALGALASLRYLDLSTNSITGQLPSALSALTELVHLSAHSNGLSGELPIEALAPLTNISYLNLKHNALRGAGDTLPLLSLANLRYLNLRHNLLHGGLPPLGVNDSSPIVHIDLAQNQIDGEIPAEFFSATPELRYLSLESNRLTGAIAPSISNAPKLYHLDLSSNALHGAIPPSMGELGELRYLNLRSNSLGGSLPHSVGGMLDLHYLILADNRISVRAQAQPPPCVIVLAERVARGVWQGTLPSHIGALRALHTLDMERNRLSGTLPRSLDVIRHNIFEMNFGNTPDAPFGWPWFLVGCLVGCCCWFRS